MKYIPKLSGRKVYLSPINLEDAEQYAVWLNDLATTRYLTLGGQQITVHGERAALEKLSQEHNYAIVELGSDTLLGNCGLMDISTVDRSAEVGIFIGEESRRGQGHGTEALRLLCDYAFNVLNLRSLRLRVRDFNARGVASYRKIGFRDAGRLRQAAYFAGRYHDVLLMDLLAEEFGASVIPGA